MIYASWWPSLLKHSPEKNVFSGQFNTHGIVKTQALSWKDHGRACSVCDRDRPNAFPWRGRCHAKSVTDEVEGNSVVPTYGDNRSLRPHQSQLTLRQLPLQGKPSSLPEVLMSILPFSATLAGGRGMPLPLHAITMLHPALHPALRGHLVAV